MAKDKKHNLDPDEECEVLEQLARDVMEFFGDLDSVSITVSRVVDDETQWNGTHAGNIYSARGSMMDHIERIDSIEDKIRYEDNDLE